MILRPFPLSQKNQILHDTLGKGCDVGKCFDFSVKVIVQGQGHRETFSKKVKLRTSTRDKDLQLEYKVVFG